MRTPKPFTYDSDGYLIDGMQAVLIQNVYRTLSNTYVHFVVPEWQIPDPGELRPSNQMVLLSSNSPVQIGDIVVLQIIRKQTRFMFACAELVTDWE